MEIENHRACPVKGLGAAFVEGGLRHPMRAVLFDLFGTIVPTPPLRSVGELLDRDGVRCGLRTRAWCLAGFPEALLTEELGLDASRARDIGLLYPFSNLRSFANFLEEISGQRLRPNTVAGAEALLANMMRQLTLLPGMEELFSKLRCRGFRLALISDMSGLWLPAVEELRLRERFDHLTFSCHIGACKPDRRLFLDALEGLQVLPEEAVMVGDSLSRDLKGAQQVGVRGVWFGCNGLSLLELAAALRQRRLSTVSSLERHLAAMAKGHI